MSIPVIRRAIIAGSLLLTLVLGWQVGEGDLLLPGLVVAVTIPLVASRIAGLPVDVLVAGLVLVGYLVGNRGFAQVTVPKLPLLPGELALGVAGVLAVWRFAWLKTSPVLRDSLNLWVALWIAACSARLPFDVRAHGIVALRDYALVYYALFFFFAQGWARLPESRRFIEGCLTLGFALTAPALMAFLEWPDWVTRIAIAGVPLIFVKADVATAFLAAGVFWAGWHYARTGERKWLVPVTICAGGVLLNNSRAAIVAVIVCVAGLLPLGERRVLRALAALGAVAAFGLLVEAALPRDATATSRAYRLYESLSTVFDFSGSSRPDSYDLGDKPDNNRFRLVWWQAVIEEARSEAPLTGLGFGHDLAAEFVRRYYADSSEDFSARSPHNFLITVFARTGLVGLGCFLGILGAAGIRAWRAARAQPDAGEGSRWLAPAAILVAACFGVVLEGPMGAMVFWSLLGWANAAPGLVRAPEDPAGKVEEPAALAEAR